MARRLGVNKSNYYRNEIGIAFLRLESLIRLHVDFDISLDWLLFGIEPMHVKEKQAELASDRQTKVLIDETPDVKELLTAIEQDAVLRYELLAHFYKYKQERQAKEAIPLT
jgi:transcriptional regulator with XRE-family HTH domain